MSEHISAELRTFVLERAENRCEYCGLAQIGQEATFHIDHVRPRSAGGDTTETNLALACVSCSLRKGAKESVIVADTGEEAVLFNPRTQSWSEHFRWEGESVVPLTATGQATLDLLAMNRQLIVNIRKEERDLGRHPPM